MTRTRDWIKFGGLVGVALVLALAFAAVVNFPQHSAAAQQPGQVVLPANQPAPIRTPRNVSTLSDAFAASAELVRPSVVYISSEQHQQARAMPQAPSPFDQFFPQAHGPRVRMGSGSGFIISPDGYILTNNHVVEGADRLEVKLFDKRTFLAKVVGRDSTTDVAVIKIDAHNLPAVSLGNSDSTRVGEWVLAVGNPLGEQFSFTVTAGIVSSKGRQLPDLASGSGSSIQDFIQTDAAINPGNSGGPLVNTSGQIIGINSAIASETGYYQGYGFAIPINLARNVAEQIIKTGHVTRAVLGVYVRPASAEDAAAVGLDSINGVTVNSFTDDNSPAAEAGLKPGDVITAIDGHAVDYVAQLQQAVAFRQPGERVKVAVRRPGEGEHTYTIKLGSAPGEPTQLATDNTTKPSKSGSSAERALGITVKQLTTTDAARVDQIGADHAGLLISDVDIDGPASGKVIPFIPGQGGDIITSVNGHRVHSLGDMASALRGTKPGDIVAVQIFRVGGGGGTMVFERIKLAGGNGD